MANDILDDIEDIYDIFDLATTLDIPPDVAEQIVVDQFHDISYMGWLSPAKFNPRNNGKYGLLFEKYYGIRQNRKPEADFHGCELKTSSLDILDDTSEMTLFTLGAYYGDPQYALVKSARDTAIKKKNQYGDSHFLDTFGHNGTPDKLGYYEDDIEKEHFNKKFGFKIAVIYVRRRQNGDFAYEKMEMYSKANFNTFLDLWQKGIITTTQCNRKIKDKQTGKTKYRPTRSFQFTIALKDLQFLFGPPIIHYGTIFKKDTYVVEPYSNITIIPTIGPDGAVQSFSCQKYDLATDFSLIGDTNYALGWKAGPKVDFAISDVMWNKKNP